MRVLTAVAVLAACGTEDRAPPEPAAGVDAAATRGRGRISFGPAERQPGDFQVDLHCDHAVIGCYGPVWMGRDGVPRLIADVGPGPVVIGSGARARTFEEGRIGWAIPITNLVGDIQWQALTGHDPIALSMNFRVGPDREHVADAHLDFEGDFRPVVATLLAHVREGPVQFEGDGAPGAPRSLILVGATVEATLGNAARVADVDLVAVKTETFREAGTCGPYGTAFGSSIPHRIADEEIAVYVRRTGERIANRRFTGRKRRCPSSITATVTITSTGPPGRETPSGASERLPEAVVNGPDSDDELRWLRTLLEDD